MSQVTVSAEDVSGPETASGRRFQGKVSGRRFQLRVSQVEGFRWKVSAEESFREQAGRKFQVGASGEKMQKVSGRKVPGRSASD